MKKISLIFPTLILLFAATLDAGTPSVTEIMKKLDDMFFQKGDLTATVKITQKKKDLGVKIYIFKIFRSDRRDAFLMVFQAPPSEKGNGYLKIGDNFWMYRKNTRTFQHITRDEDVSGTNMKIGDMEKKKLTELYKPLTDKNGKEILEKTMLGKIPVYKFTLVAKKTDVTYPKVTYWVRRDNFLPLKTQSFSLSGTLLRTAYFLKYTRIQGRYFLLKGLFIDEFQKGNRGLLEISNIDLKPIPDYVFTKQYLENLSR